MRAKLKYSETHGSTHKVPYGFMARNFFRCFKKNIASIFWLLDKGFYRIHFDPFTPQKQKINHIFRYSFPFFVRVKNSAIEKRARLT